MRRSSDAAVVHRVAQSARGWAPLAPIMGGMGSPGTVALVSADLMFASRLSTTMRRAGGTAVLVEANEVAAVLADIPCDDQVQRPGSGVLALGALILLASVALVILAEWARNLGVAPEKKSIGA